MQNKMGLVSNNNGYRRVGNGLSKQESMADEGYVEGGFRPCFEIKIFAKG